MSQSGNTFDTAEPMLNDALDEIHKGVIQFPGLRRCLTIMTAPLALLRAKPDKSQLQLVPR